MIWFEAILYLATLLFVGFSFACIASLKNTIKHYKEYNNQLIDYSCAYAAMCNALVNKRDLYIQEQEIIYNFLMSNDVDFLCFKEAELRKILELTEAGNKLHDLVLEMLEI